MVQFLFLLGLKGTNVIDKVGQFLSDISFLVGFGENSHTHAIGDNVYTKKINRKEALGNIRRIVGGKSHSSLRAK